jgi:hypothetical protein
MILNARKNPMEKNTFASLVEVDEALKKESW